MKHFLCFTLALAAPLFAGVRVQSESVDLGNNEVTKREILVDGDRMRINETGKSTNTSVLFLTDGGRNRMVILDKAKNTYSEIDQQMIDQMNPQANPQMAAANAQMQEQMKNMTPEQRAMMEQMMKGRGMPGMVSTAVATNVRTNFAAKGSGSANGFSCAKFEGTRGAEKVSEVCTIAPAELKFAQSDFQVYERMKDFTSSMMSMAASSPFFNAGTIATMTENGFSGFPVQQTTFKGGKATNRTDTKAIERATFSNADFSLGDAKKVDMMNAAKGRGK